MSDEDERAPSEGDARALMGPEDVRTLYGPGVPVEERRAVAARLHRAVLQRSAEIGLATPAAQETTDEPVIDGATSPGSRSPGPPARSRHALALAGAGLAVVLGLSVGYGLGTAGSVPRTAGPGPTPRTLPTVLYFDDRDGQVARVAYVRPGDRRSRAVRLPEMLSGWTLSAACLSRTARPRAVPTQTVLLLDAKDRQLGAWTLPCDAVERRYFAIPAPARPATVRLVLVLNEAVVRQGWVTIDPYR